MPPVYAHKCFWLPLGSAVFEGPKWRFLGFSSALAPMRWVFGRVCVGGYSCTAGCSRNPIVNRELLIDSFKIWERALVFTWKKKAHFRIQQSSVGGYCCFMNTPANVLTASTKEHLCCQRVSALPIIRKKSGVGNFNIFNNVMNVRTSLGDGSLDSRMWSRCHRGKIHRPLRLSFSAAFTCVTMYTLMPSIFFLTIISLMWTGWWHGGALKLGKISSMTAQPALQRWPPCGIKVNCCLRARTK